MKLRILFGYCLILLLLACDREEENDNIVLSHLPELPAHFPEMDFPEDNPFSEEAWQLGKELFYSPLLSLDTTISCGTCHKAHLAFADDLGFSLGVANRIGTRNAPTLANVAFHPYYTRDGGVPTLEMQALVPIQEHNELDFNIVLIAERLNQDSHFVSQSKKIYNREPDAFVITRALSTFQRSLVSANSKYDQYLKGIADLSNKEELGRQLFFSERLACGNCHSDFDFTDYSITNNGLYSIYNDPGRYRVTLDSSDLATFKVPSLRNIEITAPYMHDGSLTTLEEVIDHYENSVNQHQNLDERIRAFELSKAERENLIAFLRTLTDHHFLNNPDYLE